MKTARRRRVVHFDEPAKPILVHLLPTTLKLLEKYAPGRGRKRSRFIDDAVMQALMAVIEVETERAYRRNAHIKEEPYPFDPEMWAPESEAIHPEPAKPRRKRKKS